MTGWLADDRLTWEKSAHKPKALAYPSRTDRVDLPCAMVTVCTAIGLVQQRAEAIGPPLSLLGLWLVKTPLKSCTSTTTP